MLGAQIHNERYITHLCTAHGGGSSAISTQSGSVGSQFNGPTEVHGTPWAYRYSCGTYGFPTPLSSDKVRPHILVSKKCSRWRRLLPFTNNQPKNRPPPWQTSGGLPTMQPSVSGGGTSIHKNRRSLLYRNKCICGSLMSFGKSFSKGLKCSRIHEPLEIAGQRVGLCLHI